VFDVLFAAAHLTRRSRHLCRNITDVDDKINDAPCGFPGMP